MGALERDNGMYIDNLTKQKKFQRLDVSPLAITSRTMPNSMLGGPEGFKELTLEANKLKVKIVVDCLTRVSSSRYDKRYKNLLLYKLDEQGKKNFCYGTDGRSLNFEDTIQLNYRKKKAWDLLIEEAVQFTDKYGIQGLHLGISKFLISR
jgi:hypothetical protein